MSKKSFLIFFPKIFMIFMKGIGLLSLEPPLPILKKTLGAIFQIPMTNLDQECPLLVIFVKRNYVILWHWKDTKFSYTKKKYNIGFVKNVLKRKSFKLYSLVKHHFIDTWKISIKFLILGAIHKRYPIFLGHFWPPFP